MIKKTKECRAFAELSWQIYKKTKLNEKMEEKFTCGFIRVLRVNFGDQNLLEILKIYFSEN